LIPDGVTGIFHWHNPSGRTMAPGSTQPQQKRVKTAGELGWRPYHFQLPNVLTSESLKLLELSGPVQVRTHSVFSQRTYTFSP